MKDAAAADASLGAIRGLAVEGLRVLNELRRTQEALVEQLAVAAEHDSSSAPAEAGAERRRAEIVGRLLASESLGAAELAELDYQIHARWHLGVIVVGAGAGDVLRRLSRAGKDHLLVSFDTHVWIWYGSTQRTTVEGIEQCSTSVPSGSLLAIGEPGQGVDGWRLTHRQAHAALGVALHKPERFARYTDHRLLAAVLENETLARSLEQKYLRLLSSQRDGGAKLRQTLRAHIDAGCIASSAASALRVDRHTVEDRVRTAERLLGCSLRVCLAELDVALRVGELNSLLPSEEPSAGR